MVSVTSTTLDLLESGALPDSESLVVKMKMKQRRRGSTAPQARDSLVFVSRDVQ